MKDRVYKANEVKEGLPFDVRTVGNIIRIAGMVFEGGDDQYVVIFPGGQYQHSQNGMVASEEQWAAILKASDDPLYYDEQSHAWLRKAQRAISGRVQQQIWTRDGYKCMYCGKRMGEVLMTVDHFVPLELSGEDRPENYLTACKTCNKEKGAMSPIEWCKKKRLDYNDIVSYLYLGGGKETW